MTFWLLRNREPRCGVVPDNQMLASDPLAWYRNLVFVSRAEGATMGYDGPQLPKERFAIYLRLTDQVERAEDAIVFERGNIGREPVPAGRFKVPPDYRPAV